jgi:hypothetical protein
MKFTKLSNTDFFNKFIIDKLTANMVRENTSILTKSCYNTHINYLKGVFDPLYCIEVPPYYQIQSQNNKWFIILIKNNKVYTFEELKDMTTEDVLEYFSLVDIKEVVCYHDNGSVAGMISAMDKSEEMKYQRYLAEKRLSIKRSNSSNF